MRRGPFGVWEIQALHRPVLLFLLSLACVSALVSACAGAEQQDVLAGTSESSTSSSSSSSGNTASSSSSGSSGTSSSSSGASGTSSGTSGVNQDCASEEEPNDSKQTANELSPARCGNLSRQDQKDFLTFRLAAGTRRMSLRFTGQVRLTVDVRGKPTTELTPDNAGAVPFVMNEDYTIEVTALSDADSVPWRVELIETK